MGLRSALLVFDAMGDQMSCASGRVVRIIAHVGLESDAEKQAKVERFRNSDWATQPRELARIEQSILDPSRYKMTVKLSADFADGRRIAGGGFEFGGPRRGVGAIWWRYRGPRLSDDEHEHERLLNETYHVGRPDIEDAIDQMLGREPEQHRPPRLSWEGLQRALTEAGIVTTERELIAAPLIIELSPEVEAEIAHGT
jgi:hypothetical protein